MVLGGKLSLDNQSCIKRSFFSILKFEKKCSTVKLGDKERFDKEQIGVKEPFPETKYQFTS